jgi:protein phosphatase
MTDLSETETYEFTAKKPTTATPRSTRPSVRFVFAAISHPGKVRTNNEDHYLVSQMGRSFDIISTNMPEGDLPDHLNELAYGMVVADGMGGMAAGEKASWLAIRTGVHLVLNSPVWATNLEDPAANQLISRMREYFRKVDSVVIGEARSDRHLSGMGTTLTLAYIVGTDVFVIHVGDSRAYLFRGGKLEQLTRDHTMAQGLADLGAIKPEDVHRHAKRHVLTNFVGGPTTGVEPEITTLQLQDGDHLLLCSDGLTEMVSDEEITRVLATSQAPNLAAMALIDLALQNGGRDNVTVALARCIVDRAH